MVEEGSADLPPQVPHTCPTPPPNQDAELSWQTFQDCMEVEVFSGCDEAFVADALFSAYRSGSEEAVRKLVKDKSAFKHLDNQVGGVMRHQGFLHVIVPPPV